MVIDQRRRLESSKVGLDNVSNREIPTLIGNQTPVGQAVTTHFVVQLPPVITYGRMHDTSAQLRDLITADTSKTLRQGCLKYDNQPKEVVRSATRLHL